MHKAIVRWWPAIAVMLSVILSVGFCFVYINHVQAENDKKWCELISFYDDYYIEHPPTNDLQIKQRTLMHNRRLALHCPTTKIS